MYRLFTLITLIQVISILSIFSQTNSIDVEGSRVNVRMFNDGKNYNTSEGSPYLFDDFKTATINNSEKKYKVRYNAYKDNFELQLNNDAIIILDETSEDSIQIKLLNDDRVFIKVKNKSTDYNYLELLWQKNSKTKLFKAYSITFQPAVEANGYQASKNASFSELKIKYVFLNEEYVELPKSKRKIFNILFDSSVKTYAKKNNLDPRNEKDLIKLLDYYIK